MTISRAASLATLVLFVSSCSKLRAIGGGASGTPQASQAPITGYNEDGQEVRVLTGPLPSHAGKNQGWQVQPLKCSVDERILEMCGVSPLRPAHSSLYVPSFQIPHPPVWRPPPQPRKHH